MGGCCFVCIYVCEGVGKRGGGKRVERTIINRICAILWLSIWSIHKQLLFSLSLVLYAQMLRNGLFLSFKPARCLSKKKKKNSHKSKKDVGEGGTYEKKKSKKKAKIVSPSLSLLSRRQRLTRFFGTFVVEEPDCLFAIRNGVHGSRFTAEEET